MKSRLIAITIAIFAALTSLAMQGPDDRPSLYVFCGPGPNGAPCEPCEAVHRDYGGQDARLRNSLKDDFRSVAFYDVRKQPKLAKLYEIDRWPTFVVIRDGKVVNKIVGYNGAYRLWQDLTANAATTTPVSPVTPVTQSKLLPAVPRDAVPDPPSPKPATPAAQAVTAPPVECIDGVCRVLATTASTQADDCRRQIDQLQKRLSAAESLTVEQSSSYKADIVRLERQISTLAAQSRSTDADFRVVPSSKPTNKPTAPPAAGRTTDPANPGTDAATRDAGSRTSPVAESRDSGSRSPADSDTGNKWLSVLKWAGTTAIAIAAPEIAIPATAGITAIGYGLSWLSKRKKKGLTDADDSATNTGATVPEDFKIENLPLQHIDYTSCWGEHWRNQHADPATALRELELYVQAWQAVQAGTLVLPGIDNPKSVFDAVNRWVNRQVTDHAQKALTRENTNHKVFYAYTWKDATNNIREGTWRTWKPNPPAADAIDDWVAARLTEKLTQSVS